MQTQCHHCGQASYTPARQLSPRGDSSSIPQQPGRGCAGQQAGPGSRRRSRRRGGDAAVSCLLLSLPINLFIHPLKYSIPKHQKGLYTRLEVSERDKEIAFSYRLISQKTSADKSQPDNPPSGRDGTPASQQATPPHKPHATPPLTPPSPPSPHLLVSDNGMPQTQ